MRPWLNLCLAVLTAGSFYGQQAADGFLSNPDTAPGGNTLGGSYSIVVEGCDWGSAVSAAILELDAPVSQVSPEQFLVVEEKQSRENSSVDIFATSGALTITRDKREITQAYLCDENGGAVEGESSFIALEFTVAPDVGSPLCYHPEELHYRWASPYRLVIQLAPGQSITSGKIAYTQLSIARTATSRHTPLAELFTTSQHLGVDHNLSYASYKPPQDGQKHPLVIWLHGLGEGGSDPLMPLWGGRVTTFVEPEFQSLMGGAHVLIPQCPTFWLDNGSGQNTTDGQSTYTKDLLTLIRYYMALNPDVDPSRVYLGGSSNGGYMTIALLLEAPELFAAAFPVCQAYENRWLTDEDIQTLTDIPLWFVHSELDQVCPPDRGTFPTVSRLLAASAADVRLTQLGEISDGNAYQYNPHYAWVPTLSGDISNHITGESLFSWLAAQSKN